MRYLYFQDFHISGKNSANYISDYFKDCLNLLNDILILSKKYNVEAIIDGGDLFHTYAPSYNILDQIADRVEKNGVIIKSLFGNHCAKYHSVELSSDTALSHLQKRSKYFEYFNEIKGNDFIIKGIEYEHNIEEEVKKNGIMFSGITDQDGKKLWKIAITHFFITPKPFLPQVIHVCCDDIKTNADICLVAHYHSEWEKKVGNTLYKDIGCVGRRSITEADLSPACLLIDTKKRLIKEIKLKSAKKGKEIFDLTKIEEIKTFDKNMENFIKSLESVEFQSMNVKGIIEDVAKKSNVSREVVDLIIDKMEKINLEEGK